MSIIDKLHNLQGVIVYLDRRKDPKLDLIIYNERKLNDLFIEFGMAMDIEKSMVPTRKHTRRFSPAVENAGYIQSYWKDFTQFINAKYPKSDETH